MNENTNFCQPPLPVEQPPPFPPDFLACFPLLFSRRNLIPSFRAPEGQCHFLCLSQCLMECWGRSPVMGMAGWHHLVPQHSPWARPACAKPGLSCIFISPPRSVGFPDLARATLKVWLTKKHRQEPEKNIPLSFSGGTGRLVALPTWGREAVRWPFGQGSWSHLGIWLELPSGQRGPLLAWATSLLVVFHRSGLPGPGRVTANHPFVQMRPGRRVGSAPFCCLSEMWKQERRFLS